MHGMMVAVIACRWSLHGEGCVQLGGRRRKLGRVDYWNSTRECWRKSRITLECQSGFSSIQQEFHESEIVEFLGIPGEFQGNSEFLGFPWISGIGECMSSNALIALRLDVVLVKTVCPKRVL